jgi:hypothetical protein
VTHSAHSWRSRDEPMTPTSESEKVAWNQVRKRHKRTGRGLHRRAMSTSSESSFASSMSRSLKGGGGTSNSLRASRSQHTAQGSSSQKTFSVNSDAFESCVPSMIDSFDSTLPLERGIKDGTLNKDSTVLKQKTFFSGRKKREQMDKVFVCYCFCCFHPPPPPALLLLMHTLYLCV